MNLKHQLVVGLASCFFLCACSPNFTPPTTTGVFADTSSGLIELTIFAEPSLDNNYSFPNLRHSPVIPNVRAFYVNLPNISINHAKVFLAAEVRFTIHEDRYTPLEIQTERLDNNSYKIQCPSLSHQQAGFGLLKIPMPPGSTNRMYVIKLAD